VQKDGVTNGKSTDDIPPEIVTKSVDDVSETGEDVVVST